MDDVGHKPQRSHSASQRAVESSSPIETPITSTLKILNQKVGQVGQLLYFIGIFASVKLANFELTGRSLRRVGRVFEAHHNVEKKLAKLTKFPIS